MNFQPAIHKGSNLHLTHSKGVEAIKRIDNSDTFQPSEHNNKEVGQIYQQFTDKLASSGSYGSKEGSSNGKHRSNSENGEVQTKPILLIEVSVIKHRSKKAFAKTCAQIFMPWKNRRGNCGSC